MNVIDLKRWQAIQKENERAKRRIVRFRKSSVWVLPWPVTREWEQDLAALTEVMLREWARKVVYGGPIPEQIRPFAELYHRLHRREVESYVNKLKNRIRGPTLAKPEN